MKKLLICLLLAVSLLLTGCAKVVTPADLGWEEDWQRFGNLLAMEEMGHGFTLLDNKDALAMNDLYYAAWVTGEHTDYENDKGETVDLYDAQMYLLMAVRGDESAAEKDAADMLAAEQETYTVTDTRTVKANGISYTVITYETKGDNPYAFGISAFGHSENKALTAELCCQEGYDEDIQTIMADFLNGLHFAKEGK